MSDKNRVLRELLSGDDVVVAVEAYSALTARVVEQAGVKVAYCGGSALGGMHYAVPDHGLITTTELVEQAGRMANAISIPLISDADQAGETSLNVRRAVRDFESAGVSGIHIEDTRNPKHLYAAGDDHLQPIDEMRRRIAAAVDGRTDPDFVIIARSDELFNDGSLDEAIRRGIAYAQEGADVFMCLFQSPGNRDVDVHRMRQLTSAVPIPVADISHDVRDARAGGLKLDIFTGPSVFLAAARHREMVDAIVRDGTFGDIRRLVGDQDAYRELVRDAGWLATAADWAARQEG